MKAAIATATPDRPVRIQRKRTRGWRMPENTVSVTRPGKWGNPFRTAAAYRRWLNEAKPDASELRGKNLACWCPMERPCHADALLEYANGWGEWSTRRET